MTLTPAQQQLIANKLEGMHILPGIGTIESTCSIAAINLALSGELTDSIPECMSPVIGKWIIVIQDAMPSRIRNSSEWKALLPLAAGTGREHEKKRAKMVLNWMWNALALKQVTADEGGYGGAWAKMIGLKTPMAAANASRAAALAHKKSANAYYHSCASAAEFAESALDAYAKSSFPAHAASFAASAASDASTYYLIEATTDCSHDAANSVSYAKLETFYWDTVNPTEFLSNLIILEE